MPELPEVETVRRGLNLQLQHQPKLLDLKRSRKALRFSFPKNALSQLKEKKLLRIDRRAKYLLFDFGDKILLNHLGMTGSWRSLKRLPLKPSEWALHDHVILRFEDNLNFIFKDPRRFGYFDLIDKKEWEKSKWFSHLGPEPFEEFTGEYLFLKTRNKSAPIKNFIMDQKVVVGVGNIYASEALFHAGIQPTKKASRLTRKDCERLVQCIQKVLLKSIRAGGSTIRDFIGADGNSGYFAQTLKVYGRQGELCRTCKSPIQQVRLAGRSTFWCAECQS